MLTVRAGVGVRKKRGKMAAMTEKVSISSEVYCRRCGYQLRGLASAGVCPECGVPFDLAIHKTWTRHPRGRRAWRSVRWPAAILLLLVLMAGAAVGWLYHGWKLEEPAIRWAMANGTVQVRPIGPQWLRERAGRWEWLLERAAVVEIPRLDSSPEARELPTRLRWLKQVTIGLGLTEGWIAALGANNQLEELHAAALDDAMLRRLGRQEKLRRFDRRKLDLWGWSFETPGLQVTDSGLAALSGLPELRVLDLAKSQVTGAGLENLRHVPKLEALLCIDGQIGNDAMPAVARCLELKQLSLRRTRVTSEGIRELAGLKKLEWLDLHDTAIDDEAVETLASLPNLKMLIVSGTYVSQKGVKRLSEALPGTIILGLINASRR